MKLFPGKGASTALTKARTQHEVKAVPVLSYPAELFFGIADKQFADQPIGARRAFKAFALCYACMTYRATKFVEAPLWIVDEKDDGEHWLEEDHPLAELLERPNPDMEMADFLELVSLYLDSTAAVLMVKNRDRGGVPRSLYPYSRDEFAVEPARGRLYGKFKVQTLTGFRELGPDDVIYIKRPSVEHIMSSVAPVEAALAHINIGDRLVTAVRSYLRNAIRPGTVTEGLGNFGEMDYERLKVEMAANYAGVWNEGGNVLLTNAKLTVLPNPLADLDLGPVNADVEAAVCQAFQIHPLLVGAKVGIEGNSGFADSIKPALDLFYDVAMIPLWSRIANKMTEGLLREIPGEPETRFIRFDTTKVRSLAINMTERVEQAKNAAAFWTVNEQRAHTQKDPMDGQDEIRVPVAPGEDETDDKDKEKAPPPKLRRAK